MSLTVKLGSLAIRTLAKPLANVIKHNAREHERFRNICISFAQSLHRIDIRLRLGLLQDPAVVERQIAREVAEAEARRKRAAVPTVKTEAQTKFDEERLKKEIKGIETKAKEKNQPKVRPLSDSKAIETGANFISEGFLFCVAGGIIIFEWWRQGRKETNRRDEVQERLSGLEGRMEKIENLLLERTGNGSANPATAENNTITQQKPLAAKKIDAINDTRESPKKTMPNPKKS